MKTIHLFLVGFLLLISSFYSVNADWVINDNWEFECGNVTYKVHSGALTFDKIIHNSSDITFNNTNFNISSPNTINISLENIASNIVGASVNDNVLSFKANCTAGLVWFNISGFASSESYSVERDDVVLVDTVSDASGVVSFSSNVWSEHEFDILRVQGVGTIRINYDYGNIDSFVGTSFNAISLMALTAVVIIGIMLVLFLINILGKGGIDI